MTPHLRLLALCGALALGTSAAMADLPDVRQSGSVDYVSGGIGTDQSEAFKAAARDWPLALEFSVASPGKAQYASDVAVRIASRRRNVFDATAEGPYLLVKLPPGSYTVTASFNGKAMTRQVAVKKGSAARTSFVWPANAG